MNKSFRLNKLSYAMLGIMASASVSGLAYGNEAESKEKKVINDEIEVIQVSGIRGSIAKSMNNKRFSDGILDGISAEDIGKFPDSNVAEALQRITGVSIDRSGGEGRYVSIRGMGPSFSTVTVNGREIASESAGRSFSFDTLASELVRSVNVHKTSKASQQEGGIGGYIDIKTAMPFDFDGFHLSGSVEMNHEENSGESSPQGSFLITDSFLDDRLGLLASMTVQNRKTEAYQVSNPGILTQNLDLYDHRRNVTSGWRSLIGNAKDGLPEDQEIYSHQALSRGVITSDRSRIGGSLAAQFQASDNLVLSLDAVHSKLDVDSVTNQAYNWLWATHAVDNIDSNGTILTQTHADGYSGYASIRIETYRPSTTDIVGFNADWQISDNLNFIADASWSRAVNDNKGLNSKQTLEMLNMPGFIIDYTSGSIPSFIHTQPDVSMPSEENLGNLVPRHMERFGAYTEAENKQVKFDFIWDVEFGSLNKIQFGAQHVTRNKINNNYSTPQSLVKAYQHTAVSPQITSDHASVTNYGNLYPGATELDASFFTINEQAVWDLVNDPASLDMLTNTDKDEILALVESNGGWTAQKNSDSYTIDETVMSLYVETYLDGEISNMAWNVVAGLRYSDTQQDSHGTIRKLIGLEPQDIDKTNLTPTFSGENSITANNSYANWLPSINANLQITDELIFRAAVSETITRPTLTSLAPSLSFNAGTKEMRTATGSNPWLKPFVSTNFDVSLEWYYNEASMLTAAYFTKDVDDFIIRTNESEHFDLEFGQEWAEIVVNRPRNGEQAKVSGIELNWIHTFDNGFGFQVNTTMVDSDAELDDSDATQVFALEGLSDTSNVVGFYENGPYQLRVAYNLRSDFLQTQINPHGGEPIYVDEYDQVDVSGSYNLNDKASVYFEAINVLGSTVSRHGRYEKHFIGYVDYGPRYSVGIRASF